MELGDNIRERRAARDLTLEALAEQSGVSRAMLSDIERGARNPTIKVVCQVAAALDCTVSQLVGEAAGEALTVTRREDAQVWMDPQTEVTRVLLAPALVRRGLEVVEYTIPPGAGTGALPPHPPGTMEHITVEVGQLHCRLGPEDVLLAAGDSLFFPADVEHTFANPGTEPCRYFLLIVWGHRFKAGP
ncbi:MAG: helix-turn-helix domain-containing protein [Chloroflexia bacterium]